ncbi:hypothetical protein KY289_016523 [Solanum tuberosum]|nr:hypothetical protein KY289_016523 [Solanum tuberosum]
MKTNSESLDQILEVHPKGEGLMILRLVVITGHLNKGKTDQNFLQLALQIMAKASLARASSACFNCGSFNHKVKYCPNSNNAPSLRTEGSVHKPSINPSQTNRGARPKNTQAAGASGDNKASGPRATAHAYVMRQRDDQD